MLGWCGSPPAVEGRGPVLERREVWSAQCLNATREQAVSAIQSALRRAMSVEGVLGAAIVDYVSRMPLGTIGNPAGLDLEEAAQRDTDVVRVNLSALAQLGYEPRRVEDILITLDTEYHLLRPLARRAHDGLFIYLVLDRDLADLDTARKELLRIEELL
ncbi:hypothetical protein GCM10017771_79890 [Streptomyces capitiformicae]|uniref:Uncharacterized protein n=1 Tax=Streptomyces capitiformicae TaxID=2014920 RepID=A0A919DMD7_9ACTN|nr:hypothetical protein GCM10017771_79890 [Streptomyces capitiformicae]